MTITVSEAIKDEGQQQKHQPLAHDGGGGCGGAKKKPRECPRPKLCTIRQSAGHENVKPPAEERSRTVVEKSPLDHHRRRISELTLKLAALNSTDDGRCGSNNTLSRDTFDDPPARRPATVDDYRVTTSSGRRGRGGDDDCGRGGAGARPARSTDPRADRQLDSSDLMFKRSELRSMLDFTGECFEEVSSMLRSPRKDPKSTVSLAQVYGRSANSHDDAA